MLSYYKNGYVQSTKEAERLQQTYINVSHARGIKLGEENANLEMAKRMIKNGESENKIKEYTSISINKIQKLKEEMNIIKIN